MKKILAMMMAMVLALGCAAAEEFSESMAGYEGQWMECCHMNYYIYLPVDTVVHEVPADLAAQDVVGMYEFSDGMLAVFHRQFGRTYTIEEAYAELVQLHGEENVVYVDYNNVLSVMYTDGETMARVVTDKWHCGVYILTAIPFGDQFYADSQTALVSVSYV